MTKTACDERKTHVKSFQPDPNQDLWEDWTSIVFA